MGEDIQSRKIPKYLFLKGIFSEQMKSMEDQLAQLDDGFVNDNKVIEVVPSVFYSFKKWIKQTRILCWKCHMSHNNIPVFIPQIMDRSKDSKDEYYITTRGLFCTFPCARLYIEDSYSKIEKIEKINLLCILYEIMVGIKVREIAVAPSVYEIRELYGNGSYNIMEFRKKLESLDKEGYKILSNNKLDPE